MTVTRLRIIVDILQAGPAYIAAIYAALLHVFWVFMFKVSL